jgi:cyclopropane fatty-acyl-phospholipid synthase-like methyltransferase
VRLAVDYFEKIYAASADPWGFASRWYEARKYALTLAALPNRRYARAFEPGCSIGVLTEQLAARCDHVVAADLVPDVAARARARLIDHPNVEVRALAIPDAWPEGRFDLIVLSEVVYYLAADGVAALLARIEDSLEVGGHVVAVHWTGETDYPLSGDEAHALLDAHPTWRQLARYAEASFVLAVYERAA